MVTVYFPLDLEPATWHALRMASILLLVILLILKELVVNLDNRWAVFARFLNVAIVPFLIHLGISLLGKMIQYLPTP